MAAALLARRRSKERQELQLQKEQEERRLHDEQDMLYAATRMAAVWRGKLVRKHKVERRVPVSALITSIHVARVRRQGLVQFVVYLAYVAVLAVFTYTSFDQGTALAVEKQLRAAFDSDSLGTKRSDVVDLDSAWGYIESVATTLYDEGQHVRNAASWSAFLTSACPFTADTPSSPCQNRACSTTLRGGTPSAAEAAACNALIGSHCAAHADEWYCGVLAAQSPPAGAGATFPCAYADAGPTNPCTNAACAPWAADGSAPPVDGANSTEDGSAAARTPASVACAAIIRAHCAAFPAEPACNASAPAASRRLLERPIEAARGRQAGRAAAGRRLSGDADDDDKPDDQDRVAMVDASNKAIGPLLVWHARYRVGTCERFSTFLRTCVRAGAYSRAGFTGALTGRRYTPGRVEDADLGVDMSARPDETLPDGTPSVYTTFEPLVDDISPDDLYMMPVDVGNYGVPLSTVLTLARRHRADGWLDESLSVLLLTLNVYNANVQRYASVRARFDFTRGGLVERSLRIATTPTAFWLRARPLAWAVLVLLWLDSALLLARVLRALVACSHSLNERLEAYLEKLRKRMDRGARVLRRQATSSSSLGSVQSGALRRWGGAAEQSEAAKALRAAEQAAQRPWWLVVEVLAILAFWYYVLLAFSVEELTAETNTLFEFIARRGTSDTSAAVLSKMVTLTYLVMDTARNAYYMSYSASIAMLCLLQRMFKFCLFHRRLSTISSIVSNASADMSYFLILFVMISAGFAVAATMLFGSTNAKFTTIGASASTLSLILLGSFEHAEFVALDPPEMGHVFFWLYIAICYLLLLNVLLAIILDAYILAKQSAVDEPTLGAVAQDVLINSAHDAHDGCRFVGKLAVRLWARRARRAEEAAEAGAKAERGEAGGAGEGIGAQPARHGPGEAAPLPASPSLTVGGGADAAGVRRPSLLRRLPRVSSMGRGARLQGTLTAERRANLIAALSETSSAVDDAKVARVLMRSKKALLKKRDSHLSLRDLTELFGALMATKVMRKYGQEFRDETPEHIRMLQLASFEDSVAHALLRIGRAMDRVNEQTRRTINDQEKLAAVVSELHTPASTPPVSATRRGRAGAGDAADESGVIEHSANGLFR